MSHFFAIFKVRRLETYETETRPESFEIETKTRKSGTATKSGDSITGIRYQKRRLAGIQRKRLIRTGFEVIAK